MDEKDYQLQNSSIKNTARKYRNDFMFLFEEFVQSIYMHDRDIRKD